LHIANKSQFRRVGPERSDDDVKSSKEEDKRPGASLWMKSKKERRGTDNHTRVLTLLFIAPPKTPVASKLRKDAQAKALAAEKVTATGEIELPGG
jgi:hypothetical protein